MIASPVVLMPDYHLAVRIYSFIAMKYPKPSQEQTDIKACCQRRFMHIWRRETETTLSASARVSKKDKCPAQCSTIHLYLPWLIGPKHTNAHVSVSLWKQQCLALKSRPSVPRVPSRTRRPSQCPRSALFSWPQPPWRWRPRHQLTRRPGYGTPTHSSLSSRPLTRRLAEPRLTGAGQNASRPASGIKQASAGTRGRRFHAMETALTLLSWKIWATACLSH